MVLADRISENVRNGRRSRGPSPNGHSGTAQSAAVTTAAAAATAPGGMATDTSSDEENSRKNGNTSKATKAKSEYEEKIRVGRDYQAVCPELIPQPDRKPEALNDRALLVWSPTKDIPDNKLEEYITLAKERYGYNGEQALGMLFWHKHNLERALMDLANFTPFPDEWTAEDRVLFEQAFQFHGKSFHRIRQMLPDKTIASLVKFYYSWKKTRSRTSVMDRQEKLKKNDSSENGSDHGSNEESDNEDKPSPTSVSASGQNQAPNSTTATAGAASNQAVSNGGTSSNDTSESAAGSLASAGTTNENHSGTTDGLLACTGCGVSCSEVHSTPQGKLCGSCHHHWRRTGVLRPTSGPSCMKKRARGSNILGKSGDSHKRRPPKGMYINHDDIVKLATSEQKIDDASGGVRKGIPNDDLLAGMDREIVKLLSQIQYNKQTVSGLKQEIDESLEVLKPPEVNTVRLNSRWNNEELMLAVQGVRKYGRDFQAIADTLGSKTEAQVRTFYMNYRRRFSLDAMLKEFEARNSSNAKEKSSGAGGTTVSSGGAASNKSSSSAKEETTANAATAAVESQAESTKDAGANAEGDGDVEMIDQQTVNVIGSGSSGGGKEKLKTLSTTSPAEVEIMEVK
ncbi:REST corepressor 2-like [Anopheles albimanus]|uniref:REST corepressor 2-like n=1 Tax=Anopheles albimanus TaxID=7167 RepID=UPI00164192E2|nr:REST corepressor 2-like [Anopheles albimanus]